jgi:ribosome biogenesis GTPase
MRALVLRGSRNIFNVRAPEGDLVLECRIKGKILKGVEEFYNPLAPGDWVEVEPDPAHPGKGLILALEPRRNRFTRTNQKGRGLHRSAASQLLAANLDLILCVSTPGSPPWRPRFLDRALAQADIAGIPPVVLCNKWDLFGGDPDIEERLEDFRRIGYPVLRVSARTGEGLDELRALSAGRLCALVGQSGVGKSSLINALLPEIRQRVGVLNGKYDRGNHTTSMSALLEAPARPGPGGTRSGESGPGGTGPAGFIDTPGIRRLLPDGIAPAELVSFMREFAPLEGKCSFGLSCSHRSEPGCKIMEAVAAGVIHEDRYESFLRIQDELQGTGHDD